MLSAVRLTSLRYSKLNQSSGGRWAVPEITLRPHSIWFSQQRSLLCWLNFCRSMDSGICYNLIPRWTLETAIFLSLLAIILIKSLFLDLSFAITQLSIYVMAFSTLELKLNVSCIISYSLLFLDMCLRWHLTNRTAKIYQCEQSFTLTNSFFFSVGSTN